MTEYNPAEFDFVGFANKIAANIESMFKTGNVFRVNVSGDDIWKIYIESFPEGTNPFFREKTYHEGNYDKNFIRRVGSLVTVTNGKLHSIWDVENAPFPYNVVASTISEYIHSSDINNIFRVGEKDAGSLRNFELKDGETIVWDHFYIKIPTPFYSKEAASEIGKYATNMGVFLRGLETISISSLNTILDLINDNNLYRGEEFKDSVIRFKKRLETFSKLNSPESRNRYIWGQYPDTFRNSVIGSLAIDLSEGTNIEAAVAKFESKVAPENYKRPKALITQSMIKDAFKTIEDLGLSDSLERRHAVIDDISVNEVIWVNRASKNRLKGSTLFDSMMKEAAPIVKIDSAVEISGEEFFSDILPKATELEILFGNNKKNNLMSITAPVHADAPNLFKWDNGFGWSYNGEIADTFIRDAVKARGGSVSGVFRFSHSWNHEKRNASLMDLHVFFPNHSGHSNGTHDKYGNNNRIGWNNRTDNKTGGVQDVDYTNPAPAGYIPVENITFPDLSKMPEGNYECKIHNWQKRHPNEGGFRAEIEIGGQIFEYDYDKPLGNKEWVHVATVNLKNGKFTITHHIPSTSASKTVWGIDTEKFVKVNAVINSPNYWDEKGVGNRHWFFIMDGCKNPEETRGIYNEFLRPELDKHRKVFEVLGSKTKCEVVDDQLSGLGFSSTRKDKVTFKVKTEKSSRVYEVQF